MKTKIFLIGVTFLLAATHVSAKCKASREVKQQKVSGNAGCLIKIGDQMVFTNEEKMGFSPPGGQPETRKGKKERVWQTACREIDEEVFSQKNRNDFSKVQLHIEKLLHSFDGKFYLFQCSVDATTANQLKKVTPYAGKGGAAEGDHTIQVSLQNPQKIPAKKWRFPKQREKIVRLFQAIR